MLRLFLHQTNITTPEYLELSANLIDRKHRLEGKYGVSTLLSLF